ncbi:hypothetical protein L3Q82_002120 [Scortum barcoo]|uniref:Uncharacterized protein n=1 Tax=Scortum barcoo TaxID=214431 RepID=A0ACB8W1N9_9TELE|nr:hypothetical protein L3Q82_002120 [Scortum barcoo]
MEYTLGQQSIEMSGTGEEISQVHWKQQWLENGTLYFHVSMTESELLAQTTQPTAREPAHVLHEHMHLLHISVMGRERYKQLFTEASWQGSHMFSFVAALFPDFSRTLNTWSGAVVLLQGLCHCVMVACVQASLVTEDKD